MDKSKVKILVVDDEQGLCAGVQEALRREGYMVDAMTDAPAALKLTEERLYNLVISDIKMPGLSGLELLSRVRAHSRDTLIILMTAYGTVESARSEEHTSELQSLRHLVCRLLLEKKKGLSPAIIEKTLGQASSFPFLADHT